MSRDTHILLQCGLVILGFLPTIFPTLFAHVVHESWHQMVAAIQGVLAIRAHNWNRDGSPSPRSTALNDSLGPAAPRSEPEDL